MSEVKFYKYRIPNFEKKRLPGKLLVLEGTDGVGRSTQIALLREWLESEGYGVSATGLKRGKLAGKAIQMAMEGHTLGDATMNLSYATDFADRLERDIIPSLRAGFIVLLDRYIYSIIARAQVRGADPTWIRNVLGFAIIPDATYYLQADLAHLIPRVLNARGFSYWESGMDFLKGRDYYDSYNEYQARLIAQFDAMAEEFDFVRIDANKDIREVFKALKNEILELIKDMKPLKKAKRKKEDEKKPEPKGEKEAEPEPAKAQAKKPDAKVKKETEQEPAKAQEKKTEVKEKKETVKQPAKAQAKKPEVKEAKSKETVQQPSRETASTS
ncbi:MAG: thymidylate kinase [Anaerolineales bacterium]|nr:thymidylate kinase [Anaerolineales bacterium]